MRRTDLMDTSEWAHREMVRLLRGKSVQWKVQRIFELNDLAKELRRATAHFRESKKP